MKRVKKTRPAVIISSWMLSLGMREGLLAGAAYGVLLMVISVAISGSISLVSAAFLGVFFGAIYGLIAGTLLGAITALISLLTWQWADRRGHDPERPIACVNTAAETLLATIATMASLLSDEPMAALSFGAIPLLLAIPAMHITSHGVVDHVLSPE